MADGQEAKYLLFVTEGKVDLRFEMPMRATSKEMTVITILPGKSFGFSSLVGLGDYTLSSYCATDKCVLVRIKGEDLSRVFEEDNSIGYIVMFHLAQLITRRYYAMREELVKREGHEILGEN